MPNSALELERERFLDQLHSHQVDLSGHESVSTYWQDVAREAHQSEDLGQLDLWVKELSRDKDRLAELRARQQQAASSQMGAAESVAIITRLLALLDDIGVQLRRRLAALREQLGIPLILLGMRNKAKPKDADKKEEQTQEALLQKKQEPVQPTKTKAP